MAASRKEAEKLAAKLKAKFPKRVQFIVEDNWDEEGDFFSISVIAELGYEPDLEAELPSGWEMVPWFCSDQRSNLTSITEI